MEAASEKFRITKIQVEEEKSRLEQTELKDDALQSRLQTEERRLKESEKEVEELKKDQYKKGQILFNEKQQETNLTSSISGIASQDKNMRSKITAIDEQVERFSLSIFAHLCPFRF